MDRRIDTRGGLSVLTARLIGPRPSSERCRLVLDTGAERTVIRPALLRAAGYDLTTPFDHGRMRSATGSERVPVIWLASLQCCGVERHSLRVLAHDMPSRRYYDGLLGLDFIRPGPLHIDFLRGTVRLGPRRWWPFGR